MALTSQDILNLVNQQRQQAGDAPLKFNDALNKAAQAKAQDMVDNNYFAHTSPKGVQGYTTVKNYGYNYAAAGENLARGFNDPQSLVTGWINSPMHKKVMLEKYYNDTGIAVVKGKQDGQDSYYVVQFFGTPQQQAKVQPKVQPKAQATTQSKVQTPVSAPKGFIGPINPVSKPSPRNPLPTDPRYA